MGAAPAELAASHPVGGRRAPASGTITLLPSRPTGETTLSAHKTQFLQRQLPLQVPARRLTCCDCDSHIVVCAGMSSASHASLPLVTLVSIMMLPGVCSCRLVCSKAAVLVHDERTKRPARPPCPELEGCTYKRGGAGRDRG